MTNVCPRCRAPLMGPVCASCGAPAPVAAWGQPPPGGFYPGYPMMQPGMPMPYMMAPVPMQPPKKTMAVIAGIISLCASALVVIFLAVALANHDFTREDGATGVAGFTMMLTLAAALFSVFSIQGKWWGALTAAILQTVNVIMTLAMCGLCQEAARHARYRTWDSYDYDYSFYGDSDAAKKLEALSGMFALSVVGVLTAMILLYVGIGGAKRWAQYRRHLAAHEAF